MKVANHGGAPVVIDGETVVALDGPGDRGPARFINAITQLVDRCDAPPGGDSQPLDLAKLGPPVPVPGKILGAPVNYRSHREEMKVEHTVSGLGFFLKSPSSVTGMSGVVPVPFPERRTDQEAELGVVIGRSASNVVVDDALDCVFGYTCLIDVTVRGNEERSTRKSFP
ncbi:MAG: fumarylacetoacetate hydrolase family protein, partial [Acidimicrobiia bacterium]|nr:fumarylacetoacetate hydrolase family protein [Acidimicrobiia bacterium]